MGRTVVAWAGAGCAPGRGGGLVVGARGGCGFWWWRSFLWVRCVVLGVAFSPWWWVVVVVTISLGSVKGCRGRGLGFG